MKKPLQNANTDQIQNAMPRQQPGQPDTAKSNKQLDDDDDDDFDESLDDLDYDNIDYDDEDDY